MEPGQRLTWSCLCSRCVELRNWLQSSQDFPFVYFSRLHYCFSKNRPAPPLLSCESPMGTCTPGSSSHGEVPLCQPVSNFPFYSQPFLPFFLSVLWYCSVTRVLNVYSQRGFVRTAVTFFFATSNDGIHKGGSSSKSPSHREDPVDSDLQMSI